MFDTPVRFLECLSSLPSASKDFRQRAIKRQAELTKPGGALGRLEDIAIWLSGWQETEHPRADVIQAILFAGNHGVVEEGISSYPSDVTAQMVANFEAGGAAINVLSTLYDQKLEVVALDLEKPTKNFTKAAALSEQETLAAINLGAQRVNDTQADVVYFGEMGIGNTTSAAALAAAVFGGVGRDWAGPGTGLNDEGIVRKAQVVDKALTCHAGQLNDAFSIMQRLGGRELAAIMGGVVAARLRRLPVLVDGFVVTAAIAPLTLAGEDILDHCLSAHCSAEPAHKRLLDCMYMSPLLKLDMRLGEGTGAALAAELVKAAVATHNRMATFASASVSSSL